ncbi:MAG: ATP-grasp domain-containing protein [Lachnospiraceae bacterium]|nr:ATP-grasp domain-containing protein [Lachnospiraceae bacterium]
MKKIVVIGANSFQNPLIIKAKEMGFETHVFAWREGSIGERTADYFYPVSIVERERILEECRRIKPEAVVSIGSDLAMLTVNYVAEELGLPCNSMECTHISTNKYQMRRAFQSGGLSVPRFCKVGLPLETKGLEKLTLPVIVKPTDRSGSRGITKLETWEGLWEAMSLAVENSFEKKAIVEECLEGQEYSCECISYEGVHKLLALTKKYTTGHPHFIETGHLEPSGLSQQETQEVQQVVFQALDALKVRNGASHTEFMLNKKGQVQIIETGARMGGDCIGSNLVPLSTGYDYVRMVIDVACGKKPDFSPVGEKKVAYIHFIFTHKDLELLRQLKKRIPENIQFVSELEEIHEGCVRDSSTRFGYFILAFDNLSQAKEYVAI